METTTTSSASALGSGGADALSFAGCCRMLESVEKTPKSDAKLRLVFSDALRRELGAGGDVYPLLRLLLPQLDRERSYNLREKKLARAYADMLGLAPESRDARKLELFNDPAVVQSKAVGDFTAVLHDVLVLRSLAGSGKHAHTVGAVNALLDELARADTAAARKKVFMRLATEFPAGEQKWLVRIVLKDLKVGLHHERVLSFLHPDAAEMYNHTNDLHKVCLELRNSSVRYVPTLEPFQVFSPMLAKRVDFGESTRALNADAFVMEPKLDGERITCHVRGDEVQFISRNGVNYTELYGPSVAPYVRAQVRPGADYIFDGEMMVWDNLEYRMRDAGRWLCYVAWDIVYVGGSETAAQLLRDVYRGPGNVTAVMGLPLFARRQLLEKVLTSLDHRVTLIEQTLVDAASPKERHELVMAEVDWQVAAGGEGVILKDVNSHYMCGESSRKAKKWIKLKPDYAGLTTSLDVLIIGGFYGTDRRRSGDVLVFLLGVLSRALDDAAAQEATAPGAPCPVVCTFAKVGTGYNFEELAALRRELEPHWQPWDPEHVPAHLNGWRPVKSDLKPDVWIDPRHSKVLEVYGFELTFSTLYQTGLTIRFPRCKAVRHDKPWYQCMSMQDLNAARGSAFNKRAADVALGQKKAAKRVVPAATTMAARRRPVGGVVAAFSPAPLDGVALQRNVFEGKEFCVLPGKYNRPAGLDLPGEPGRSVTKQAVETLLYSYGAAIVQNPLAESTSFVVAASNVGFKVANLAKQGRFDIVHLHWVAACVAAARLLPLKASGFVVATDATRALLAKDYDAFGDHFTEHTQPAELRLAFREVRRQHTQEAEEEPWQTRIKALAAEEADAMESELTFLAHCVVYFDQYTAVHAASAYAPPGSTRAARVEAEPFGALKLLSQQVRLFGGTVAHEIDETVTHIVVARRADPDRLAKLQPVVRALRHQRSREPPVVLADWVTACVAQRVQLPIDGFFVAV
ncbi:hypothetical protein PybrP1_005847 [[Pythium] brassicae (nom. inval.)]|nr:hypothetical protein PybrP1_005847 [[Pythium] brassicae (nom. inval.)]